MKLSGGLPPAEGDVRVQISVRAEGQVTMDMSKDDFERLFPEDGDISGYEAVDEVVMNGSDDLLNSLEWEISDVNEVRRRPVSKPEERKDSDD